MTPTAAGGDTLLIASARALATAALAALPVRWSHVQGVAAAASRVAPLVEPGHAEELIAAAWMHDIGYSPDLASTGFHPVDGAAAARTQGFSDLVVGLIAHHTGASYEAEQRGLVDELDAFPVPPRHLLDVVTFADLTTSPTGAPVEPEERVAEILSRYASGPVFEAVTRSAPELIAAAQRVRQRAGRPEEARHAGTA